MSPFTDFEMPPAQDAAGREFDQWFDWNSATEIPESTYSDTNGTRNVQFPISPSATDHSDGFSSTMKPPLGGVDMPTPVHSSSSPETRTSLDLRLSGETLREYSRRPQKKRKYSTEETAETPQKQNEIIPAVKKRPHNIIEKRYRANLNEKIAELRDSVPSLRILKKTKDKDDSNGEGSEDEVDGSNTGNKLNKASILTKAVEYIRHLEIRTKRLEDENRSLKERLETLDKVIAQGGHDSQRATAFTSDSVIEEPSKEDDNKVETAEQKSDGTTQSPQGLIPLPESWRQLRQNQPQEHYGHIYDKPSKTFGARGKWSTRIMIGSLAGLMVMGLSETDEGTASREKGLFGIPLELLDGWKFLRSPRLYLSIFAQYCRTGGILPLVKGFCALTILAFLVFAYLFNSKPSPKDDLEEDGMVSSQLPSPASPIEVRRRAWSTSMQALKIPPHSFFPEWFAVTSEWLNYSVLYLFGSNVSTWLTGRSPEEEKARIKAWDIAIDAQLAGGDIDVSRSRIVLTSFGAGTLPKTPLRLMLKALHCRVLLWHVGGSHLRLAQPSNKIGKFFANREWRHAQRLHQNLHPRDTERLPDYLAALLQMDCDDVFLDHVVQRAYNLTYDRSTEKESPDTLMDVIVEDYAVRSPLDAIAAWRSTCAIRRCLEIIQTHPGHATGLQEALDQSLRLAPPGTVAETRSLMLHAILANENREIFYKRAMENFEPSQKTLCDHSFDGQLRIPQFIDSSTPSSVQAEIETCLHCAQTLLVFNKNPNAQETRDFFLSNLPSKSPGSSLASIMLQYTTSRLPELEVGFHPHSRAEVVEPRLDSNEVGLTLPSSMSQTDNLCMHQQLWQHKRRQSNESNDTGYETQEEHLWGI